MADYQYVDVNITNTEDALKRCIYNETRSRPILDRPEDYYLNVIRLRVPTSQIALLNISTDDYNVGVGQLTNSGSQISGQPMPYKTGYATMPRTGFVSKQYLVDGVNRSILKSFWEFCADQYLTPTGNSTSLTLNGATTLTDASPSTTFTCTARTDTNLRMHSVNLRINSLAYASTASGADQTAFKMYLTSPEGSKIYITSDNFQIGSGIGPITNLTFADWSYVENDSVTMGSFTGPDMQPRESFLDLAGEDPVGAWTLGVEFNDASASSEVVIDADLIIRWSPNSCVSPPVLLFDALSDVITMSYPEKWYLHGYQLMFSKNISNLLGFEMKTSTLGLYNHVIFPQRRLSVSHDQQIEFHASRKSSYLMDGLYSVELRTQMPLEAPEFSENVDNNSQRISDFLPDSSQLTERDNLYYNASSTYRKYSLTGRSPLSNLSLEVWCVMTDGSSSPLYLAKGEVFNAKIQFEKKLLYKDRY